jgi:hypothetical protein
MSEFEKKKSEEAIKTQRPQVSHVDHQRTVRKSNTSPQELSPNMLEEQFSISQEEVHSHEDMAWVFKF